MTAAVADDARHAAPRGATVGGRMAFAAWLAAAAALGALQTLAFVHTQAWPLQMAATAVLAWLAARVPPRRAAALGLAYGTAWLVAGTWWMFISMHRYGGMPAWMAALAVLALCAFLSLYLAAAMAAFARWRSGRPLADALLFGALWLLAELARGVIFTGFPWVASGYAHVESPLAALAPWLGVYGVGAVAAALAAGAALAALEGRRRWAGAAVAAALPAALALAGAADLLPRFTRPTGTLAVSLLQGNVPQDEKFERRHRGPAIRWHLDAMAAAQGVLVMAPETAIPLLPEQLPPGFFEALGELAADKRAALLFGVPLDGRDGGHTNSALGYVGEAGTAQPPYRYDKHHLVPFGEFIPLGFKWFTRMMHIPLGDFDRGPADAPSLVVRGERVAPNICYEDLFGEELAARFRDPAQAPTLFANLSNIGWFGDTVAVPQHLNISRMRSLEFERAMLRSTNTGATAVIDHRGRVTHALAPYTRGVLEASVEGREGLTPFARWSAAAGLWPPFLAALAVVAWAALARRRSRGAGAG